MPEKRRSVHSFHLIEFDFIGKLENNIDHWNDDTKDTRAHRALFFPSDISSEDKRNPTSLFVFEVSSFITKYRPVFSCHPRILDILLSARYSPFNKLLHASFSCRIRQCKIVRSLHLLNPNFYFLRDLSIYIRNRWVECIVSDEDRVYQSRRSIGIKFGRFVNELTDYRYVHTGIFVRIIDTMKSTTVPMIFEKLSII